MADTRSHRLRPVPNRAASGRRPADETNGLVARPSSELGRGASVAGVPQVIIRAGKDVERRFLEFFTANIRNRNTRTAYGKAVGSILRMVR